jgi:hypothetical protein
MPIDKRPSHEIARERVNMLAHELGLELRAQFVPFSQSRNAKPRAGQDKPWQSLNWRVTLERNGRPVLESDYSQGVAYCPASKAPAARFPINADRQRAIALEIESGRVAKPDFGGRPYQSRQAIPAPELADVLCSLVMDGEAIEYANFAQWADELGYSPDSISAESTYRECLAIGLALRSAIGESALAKLQDSAREM